MQPPHPPPTAPTYRDHSRAGDGLLQRGGGLPVAEQPGGSLCGLQARAPPPPPASIPLPLPATPTAATCGTHRSGPGPGGGGPGTPGPGPPTAPGKFTARGGGLGGALSLPKPVYVERKGMVLGA